MTFSFLVEASSADAFFSALGSPTHDPMAAPRVFVGPASEAVREVPA
jgi:hypothetical protein